MKEEKELWIIDLVDADGVPRQRIFNDKSRAESFCDVMEECGIQFQVRYVRPKVKHATRL